MTKGVLPTKRQVIEELKAEIAGYRRVARMSYAPRPNTMHTIRCLEMALLMVKEWKGKR